MADYIDREKLLEKIDELKKRFWYIYTNPGDGGYEAIIRRHATKCVVDLCVLKAPAADVTEVRHGEWVKPEDEWEACVISCICSVCGWRSHLFEDDVNGMPYCPSCGAKMDGDGNK